VITRYTQWVLENVWTKLADRCVSIVVGKIYIYINSGLAAADIYNNNMFVLRSSCAFRVRAQVKRGRTTPGHTPSTILNCITFPPRFFIFIFIIVTIYSPSTSSYPSPTPLQLPTLYHYSQSSSLYDGYNTSANRKNANYNITSTSCKEKNTEGNYLIPNMIKHVLNPKICLIRYTTYITPPETGRSIEN